MCEEKRQELVRPHRFLAGRTRYADSKAHKGKPGNRVKPKPNARPQAGKPAQQKEGWLKCDGESDTPIVLGDGRADHRGKGCTKLCSPQRKHVPDMQSWRIRCKPHCGEYRNGVKAVCKASNFEKPGAVVPLAGICEGAVG
jgi:hypothetical protein